jgi:hypothetical protein
VSVGSTTMIDLVDNTSFNFGGTVSGGFSFSNFSGFAGFEGAFTLGFFNFAAEVENIGGIDYKQGARDWRVTSNSKYGGSKPNSNRKASINRMSAALGIGVTAQTNIVTHQNGAKEVTESATIGYGAFGLQVNFDTTGGLQDVRLGLDSGISLAFFAGIELSGQLGIIYSFK